MTQPTSAGNLAEIVSFLRNEPERLGLSTERIQIAVTHSNTKKRYTDFHRLDVVDRHGDSHRFWLRTIKNKPAEVAIESLSMQFRVQCELSDYLRHHSPANLRLGCCESVVLLPQFTSIVTKECEGTLLNPSLVRTLPLLRRRGLLQTFRNVGVWLKAFHAGFREELPGDEHAELVRQFEAQFQRPLRDEYSYATRCHFDYSPRNIFVGRGHVQVIDFAGSKPGVAQADLDFFSDYVLAARFNGLYTRSQKTALVDAFLEGYANHPTTAPMSRSHADAFAASTTPAVG